VVPKLKGKKLGAAKTALKEAGCKLGKVTKKKVKKPKPGTVLSQSPAAGDELPADSPVNVTVSQKKKKKKKK
jgi:serine/threonine-protein kinase